VSAEEIKRSAVMDYVPGQSSLKSRSGLEVVNRNGSCRDGPFSALRFLLLFSFLRLSLFGHVFYPCFTRQGAFSGLPRELRWIGYIAQRKSFSLVAKPQDDLLLT
jgi:hypothetical protein